MKNKFPIVLIAIGSAIGLLTACTQGCKTTATVTNGVTNTVTTLDASKMSASVEILVAASVPFAIEKDTNCIPYLRAAAVVFKAAAESGKYDSAQVESALDSISVNELRTPEAQAGVKAALAVYQVYLGEIVSAKLDATTWAKPLLEAIANGILAALPATS